MGSTKTYLKATFTTWLIPLGRVITRCHISSPNADFHALLACWAQPCDRVLSLPSFCPTGCSRGQEGATWGWQWVTVGQGVLGWVLQSWGWVSVAELGVMLPDPSPNSTRS